MIRTAALLTLASYVLGHGYISECESGWVYAAIANSAQTDYVGDQHHEGSNYSTAGPAYVVMSCSPDIC